MNTKKYALGLLLLGTSVLAGEPLPSIRQDTKLHFGYSYALTQTLGMVLTRLNVPYPELIAGSAIFTLGGIKELRDERSDRGDMLANTIGIGLAMGVNYSFRF